MSRILRRPMFRGGRVDSRGTGITSGLGYAKGGSVNTPKRGLVDGPGGYSGYSLAWNLLKAAGRPVAKYGKKLWQSKLNPLQDPFIKYPLKVPGAGIKGAYKLTKAAPWATIGGGTAANYMDLNPTEGTTEGWVGEAWDKGKELWEDREEIWDDINPFAEKVGGREFVGEEAEIVGDPRDLLEREKIDKIKAKIKADKEKSQALEKTILGQLNKKKTKEEKLAEMKENKEMLQEMYGSGRGEDVSNMLLNFAGKALKPEATVKSAFGEFFEEEGKRPSESKKYKDAATQGAIQMYLTGEKSFNDTMKALELFKAQKNIDFNMKDAAKKAMSISEIKNTYFTSGSMKDRQKTKGAAELWVEWNAPDGTSLTVIEGDEETPEYLQDPANEGKYIMNHETKEIFTIIDGIKQILYGG